VPGNDLRRKRQHGAALTLALCLLPFALPGLVPSCLGGVSFLAIPVDGDSAEAEFLRAKQLFDSGDYPAAVKEFARAIELNPKLPQLQSYYGLALLNTGDSVGASAAFRRELAEDPNDYAANLALGQILIVSKQYSEAAPFVRAALRRRPESIEARLAWGECLSGEGRLEEARERLEAVILAIPDSLEAHRELLSVYTRLHLHSEAALERDEVRRLQQDADAKDAGPQVSAVAPDFDLPEAGTGERVRLSDWRGKSPVVLVFGSYSCPNFRASAEALNALFQAYGRQARFYLVYIREAHAAGNWQSTRNLREGVAVAPAATMQDKEDHAAMCTRELHLKFPALVDGMTGSVEAAYAAWPSRAYVIGTDGRVRYSTRLTQLDFHAEAMEVALRLAIASK
jgi:tetratricopeptide (TPR) repeat protein